MARKTETNLTDAFARDFADRLILSTLTDLHEVVKPSEISDRLQGEGLGLATVRSLLASNPNRFAYNERRWIPAARLEAEGRPLHEAARISVDRFGAPMPLGLLVDELSRSRAADREVTENALLRIVLDDPFLLLTLDGHVAGSNLVFVARDETPERAYALNHLNPDEVADVQARLGAFDWRQADAIVRAIEAAAPVSVKGLGAAAWLALNPQRPQAVLLYDWRAFNAELLSIPGFVYRNDGALHPEAEIKKWISAAVKLADTVQPTIEVEDAAPLELKKEDHEALIAKVVGAGETVTATRLLETQFEITPAVKTFPDDLRNVMTALKHDARVWWVGGDRFRTPGSAPDFITDVPEPFLFVPTEHLQEDGDPVDAELNDDGLSTSLRKLIAHPLATDVNDEDVVPAPKNLPESMRLVLKPIHRELGTFPLSQFPTGFFSNEPEVQELLLIDADGRQLQAWLNTKARLIFGLLDWWLDQPVESGAVFSLTKTAKPNVLEFAWLDQTDPVVYISHQRMEELREIAARSEALSTFDVLREVMAHWPKGADFLTILWEVNVVRRTSRRLLSSLLSSYVCFYQRSGSPVWHYDAKKVEQGFDKTKKKFVVKP